MPNKQNDRDALCPFIKLIATNVIVCESPLMGFQDEECYSRLYFREEEKKRKHFQHYCCDKWRYCEMAQAIAKKYDDDDL